MSKLVMVAGKPIKFQIWDTAGQEDYDRLRPLSYPQTNVFLICFAVNSLTSFENVKNKWYNEIQHYAPGVPFILVGTKTDLREFDEEERCAPGFVSYAQGEALCKELKGYKYVECSAARQSGLKQVFDEAIRCVFAKQRQAQQAKKSKCLIL